MNVKNIIIKIVICLLTSSQAYAGAHEVSLVDLSETEQIAALEAKLKWERPLFLTDTKEAKKINDVTIPRLKRSNSKLRAELEHLVRIDAHQVATNEQLDRIAKIVKQMNTRYGVIRSLSSELIELEGKISRRRSNILEMVAQRNEIQDNLEINQDPTNADNSVADDLIAAIDDIYFLQSDKQLGKMYDDTILEIFELETSYRDADTESFDLKRALLVDIAVLQLTRDDIYKELRIRFSKQDECMECYNVE